MILAKLALGFSALTFLGVGLAFLASPAEMAAVIRLELGGVIATSDLRAVYGGMNLALGAFLLWSARAERRRTGLLLCFALFGGLLLGRSVGLLSEGAPEPPGFWLIGFELLGFALAGGALAGGRGAATRG